MENFEVNAKLIFTAADNQNNTYFIHVITKTDFAFYQAGSQPSIIHQSDGTIEVELNIVKNFSFPEIYVENPVVHTVNVGTFLPSAFHQINITIVLIEADSSKSIIGGDVLNSAAAVEDSRPIEIDDD